jgi:DNA-binding FrmR family transcriptional regulator
MASAARHTSHPSILLRLKRAHGHLKSVLEMIETGRPCLEIAQQLHAVEAAVANANRELIHDHIENCLGESTGVAKAELDEIKQLAKSL